MKLSVIIVNYNVEAYLEQCLDSVRTALQKVEGEVFVVDNQSTDGSLEMVRRKFPEVHLIANEENVGFSRANNQAIKLSKGKYVLLLNPDTVVGEDVFEKVCSYMDENSEVGGLGVKMIDGTGEFLPESKRGLPTPSVAFYKIIGLTRLFPRSKIFGRYQLGHLPENETSEIEILSGACMFLRSETLDKVGMLDESFFMYGEDIDLSYRILLGGWKNHYFPEARIIHYKGESTKKSSINYVLVFYNAMAIFAKKHFSSKGADLFGGLINVAIFLSAIVAIVARFLRRMILPLLDALALFICSVFIGPDTISSQTTWVAAITLGISSLSGVHDLPIRLKEVVKGPAIATILLSTLNLATGIFAWSEITQGVLVMFGIMLVTRFVLHILGSKKFDLRKNRKHRLLTIGDQDEAEDASALLWQTHYGLGKRYHLNSEELDEKGEKILKVIAKENIDQVIFCGSNLKASRIISLMNRAHRSGAHFKIVSSGGKFIIGPNSIESKKDLFMLKDNGIVSSASMRTKRILDVTLSLCLLLSLPLSIWFIKEKGRFLQNLRDVVMSRKSWVGYTSKTKKSPINFPKPGIIRPVFNMRDNANNREEGRLELIYAKDYHYRIDLRSFLSGFRELGRS